MATALLCYFNKYGYCKYGSECRYHHINDICSNANCDVGVCSLRHPRKCRYLRNFGYCKFESCCAYSHDVCDDERASQNDLAKVKVKVEEFSIALDEQLKEALNMKTKILELENENKKLREDLDNVPNTLKNVFEQAILSTTNAFVEKMSSQQTAFENQTSLVFTSLQEQIAMLMKSFKSYPPSSTNKVVRISSGTSVLASSTLQNKDDLINNSGICDQTFNSRKAFQNHRKSHSNHSQP